MYSNIFRKTLMFGILGGKIFILKRSNIKGKGSELIYMVCKTLYEKNIYLSNNKLKTTKQK